MLDVVYPMRPVRNELAVKDIFNIVLGLSYRVDGVLQLVVGQPSPEFLFYFFLERFTSAV